MDCLRNTLAAIYLVAFAALVYGAGIPLVRLLYVYNIEQHPASDLCGYDPTDPGHPHFGGRCRNLP